MSEQQKRRSSDARIDDLVEEVQKLRSMVERTNADVAGVVEAWRAVEGGVKVLGVLGKGLKFLAAVAAVVTAASAAWYSITHWGEHPINPTKGG